MLEEKTKTTGQIERSGCALDEGNIPVIYTADSNKLVLLKAGESQLRAPRQIGEHGPSAPRNQQKFRQLICKRFPGFDHSGPRYFTLLNEQRLEGHCLFRLVSFETVL